MRILGLIIFIFIFLNCSSNYSGIVYEGNKFNTIILHETTMLDVIKIYGKPKKVINWEGNKENFYKKKISFTYDISDSIHKINYITFFKNFKGKTTKGLLLNNALILDSVLKYYPNGNWEISYDSLELSYWKNNIYFILDYKNKSPFTYNSFQERDSILKDQYRLKKIKETIIY
ncbi:hypothetical protein UJ101_01294 [Flavobacteriaceae bacterium UJ101]|nr:hypothetical protein UJ101_01294 [Flavobacteriaceae bacterium UJ101]